MGRITELDALAYVADMTKTSQWAGYFVSFFAVALPNLWQT